MKLIDGRAVAAALSRQVLVEADRLRSNGVSPTMAVVVPNRDDAAAWYVRSIERTAKKLNVDCRIRAVDEEDTAGLFATLGELSGDDSVHGIICQTPLPAGVTAGDVGSRIAQHKDIDCANPLSLGLLAAGTPVFVPATAAAVMELLHSEGVELRGKKAVVVGRSNTVGKPVSMLLLSEDATVTICHSRTRELSTVCADADILVVAIGRPRSIRNGFVKAGAVVIDVGTNPTEDGGLVGDVDIESLGDLSIRITPVPGGVGPVTTVQLVRQAVIAASGRA